MRLNDPPATRVALKCQKEENEELFNECSSPDFHLRMGGRRNCDVLDHWRTELVAGLGYNFDNWNGWINETVYFYTNCYIFVVRILTPDDNLMHFADIDYEIWVDLGLILIIAALILWKWR